MTPGGTGRTRGGKAPHHMGSHPRRARDVVALANAFPNTRCWRCSLTLAEVQAQHPDRKVRWTGGHLNDSEVEGELAPECSPCNFGGGARITNSKRAGQPSRAW